MKAIAIFMLVALGPAVAAAAAPAESRRQQFLASLPARMFCTPEVSGGVKFDRETKQWTSGRFIVNAEDRFTATISRIVDRSKDANAGDDLCWHSATQIAHGIGTTAYNVTNGNVVCLQMSYVGNGDDVSTKACKVYEVGGEPVSILCDGDLHIVPHREYVQGPTMSVALSLGEAAVQHGSCTKIP